MGWGEHNMSLYKGGICPQTLVWYEDEGKDGGEASTSYGMSKMGSKSPEAKLRNRTVSVPQPSQGINAAAQPSQGINAADNLMLDL